MASHFFPDSTATTPTTQIYSCKVCSLTNFTVKTCSNCKIVHYCGVEHQRLHWKLHKKVCFPVIGKINGEYGRFLVTTRDVKKGQILFIEKPIIVSPVQKEDDDLYTICLGCCKLLNKKFDKNNKQVCCHCLWPLCDPACKKVLKHSEFECKIFREANFTPEDAINALIYFDKSAVSPNIIYDAIKVLRCWVLRGKDESTWKNLTSLEAHVVMHRKESVSVLRSNFMIKFIREYCNLEEVPAFKIEKLCGIMAINSMGGESSISGQTLLRSYIGENACKLTHSCLANSQIFFQDRNDKIIASAITDIESGHVLYEPYILNMYLFEDIVYRRSVLYKKYFLWCKCPRCSDPTELGTYTSAIRCQNKFDDSQCEGFYLPVNPLDINSIWKCNNSDCNDVKLYTELSNNVLVELKDEISKAVTLGQGMEILNKNENKVVHENHIYLINLKCIMLGTLATKIESTHEDSPEVKQMNDDFYDLASKCVAVFDKFGFDDIPLKGMLLYYQTVSLERAIHGFGSVQPDMNPLLVLEASECRDRAIGVFQTMGVEKLKVEERKAYDWLIQIGNDCFKK